MTATVTKADTTRRALLDAAETLIDEHDVDSVTVAQITAAAGQRNSAAVHYHFGSREALLEAIMRRHHDDLDSVRFAALAAIDEREAAPTLIELVHLIVQPMVRLLESGSGRAFLKVQGSAFASGELSTAELAQSMTVIGERMAPLVSAAPPEWRAERSRLVATLVNMRLAQEANAETPANRDVLEAALAHAIVATLSTRPEAPKT